MRVENASPCARQVSGLDPDGGFILSVLARRTYTIQPNGRCVLADEQTPLVAVAVPETDNVGIMYQDSDLFPYKPLTDIVFRGHAYAPDPLRRFTAAFGVGAVLKYVEVIGDRSCALSANGSIVFSQPEPLIKVPLRYDRAYGGRDIVAEALHGNPYMRLRPYVSEEVALAQASPYLYPRNPCGVGYLIEATPAATAQLRLPNLEQPGDLISPDRLIVGRPERWSLMPVPCAAGWSAYHWFPRAAWIGLAPLPVTPIEDLIEVKLGWITADALKRRGRSRKVDCRFANGASPGLQLPYLRGDETCVLVHLHPHKTHLEFQLPGEYPRIWTDQRNGKLNRTTPVLHTVFVEPELNRVSLVWRGCATALRPYFPQELETMPFRVEW